jgi:hypothetical protein
MSPDRVIETNAFAIRFEPLVRIPILSTWGPAASTATDSAALDPAAKAADTQAARR